LWERRCEGCQLVLCPPGSLVRWSVMLVWALDPMGLFYCFVLPISQWNLFSLVL
jgi:hypothetical protein